MPEAKASYIPPDDSAFYLKLARVDDQLSGAIAAVTKIAVEVAKIHPALVSTNLSENLKSRSEKMKARRRDSFQVWNRVAGQW
ncbi:MAG TPA: hypothetical protein VFY40_03775 [Blastocatellia bacterium]|nr:hypothetical protein [Blastocatellia bacterium]